MSALTRLFNYDLNQSSPVQEEFVRKVSVDEEGKEYITFEHFDSAKYQQSLGTVKDWSLDSLLKAGINPSFGIHTTNPTSLEGISSIEQWSAAADAVLSSETNE